MDGLGTEIFGAIEGDQHMVAKAAEARQTARPAFQRRQRFGEHRIKQSRLCWVQHVANVIVAGDLGDPKQALAIRAPVPMLQPPLMRQERRALHKEHRERLLFRYRPFDSSPSSRDACPDTGSSMRASA